MSRVLIVSLHRAALGLTSVVVVVAHSIRRTAVVEAVSAFVVSHLNRFDSLSLVLLSTRLVLVKDALKTGHVRGGIGLINLFFHSLGVQSERLYELDELHPLGMLLSHLSNVPQLLRLASNGHCFVYRIGLC